VRSLSSLSFSRLTLVSVTRSRYQAGRTANMKKNSYKDFIPPSIEFGNTAAEVLRYELYVERIEAKGEGREFYQEKPLRHLLQDLKNALERLDEKHDVVEIAILEREHKRVKSSIEPLDKVADRLRIENAQLDKAFNGSSAFCPLLSLSLTPFSHNQLVSRTLLSFRLSPMTCKTRTLVGRSGGGSRRRRRCCSRKSVRPPSQPFLFIQLHLICAHLLPRSQPSRSHRLQVDSPPLPRKHRRTGPRR
jgi:hypothetical protein